MGADRAGKGVERDPGVHDVLDDQHVLPAQRLRIVEAHLRIPGFGAVPIADDPAKVHGDFHPAPGERAGEVGGEQEAPAEDDEEMQALPLSGGPGVLGLDLVGEGLHPLPNGVRGQKLGVRRRGFSRHGRGTRDPMRGEIRDRRTARR